MKNVRILSLLVVGLFVVSLSGCGATWYKKYDMVDKNDVTEPAAIPKLINALQDPDKKIRQMALRCIGTSIHTDKKTMEAVAYVAQNDSWEKNRQYAIRVMRAISKDRFATVAEIHTILQTEKSELVHEVSNRLINEELAYDYFEFSQEVDSHKNVQDNNFVSISIHPAFTFDQGFTAGYNAEEFGILPVFINISNNSDKPISVDGNNIELADQSHRAIQKKSNEQVNNTKITEKHKIEFFSGGTVQPGEQKRGFIYFQSPENFTHVFGWSINIPIQGADNQTRILSYPFGKQAKIDGQPISYTPNARHQTQEELPVDVSRTIHQLESSEIHVKGNAGKIVYRMKIIHPILYKVASQELQKGYKVMEYGRPSIEAMLWLCRVLALSHDQQYVPILSEVRDNPPNKTLAKHAQIALNKI